MKLSIKVKDIQQVLEALEKIYKKDAHCWAMLGMYTTVDPYEVIHKLKFIAQHNKNLYCPNGLQHSWGDVAHTVELTFEEYDVVVLILRVMRNMREGKDLWYLS